MILLYRLFLLAYRTGIAITSLWNTKARLWRNGREGQWERLRQGMSFAGSRKRVWMHCASLGEFEQGRPVLEAIRTKYPDAFIIVTFFSPSGYEIRKNWDGADYICYLPMDGARAAQLFLNTVQPSLALFVKYEFWYFYLRALSAQECPAMLVSGAFRPSQPFFRPWGGLFRKMLSYFSLLTVQDEPSQKLLQQIGFQAHLTGDTRFDRVVAIADQAIRIPVIEHFKGTGNLVIAGSTWPEDERMLKASLPLFHNDWKLVMAPHEIDNGHLNEIRALFSQECVFFSEYQADSTARVLVVDNIGMLSALYSYGEIACIGGGFNKGGIHNVLEPAVFGLPVVMGPVYEKFTEAVALVERGYAFVADGDQSYREHLEKLIADESARSVLSSQLKAFVRRQAGATAKILNLLPQAI